MIKVRFAPSPTGFLHIGGLRTCLYNFLYAKAQQGIFVLRIEDTDQERSEDKYLKELLKMLEWLGLSADEGPFYQSQRLEIYQDYASDLIKKGMAYEEEENGKKAIRFRLPKETVSFTDAVYGEIKFDNDLNNDFIILKSDGMPTYHFACVIDDALMEITHVIRGEDHVSNTPKHIPLYQALGFKLPQYAHLPMILGADGKRLSKRHGATAVDTYQKEGFLPIGLLNYLALLGWSPGGDKEVMNLDEMIRSFTLKRINKKSAVFDPEKLNWMNGQHMKGSDPGTLKKTLKDYSGREYTEPLIKLYQSRARHLQDLNEQTQFYFDDEVCYDPQAIKKYLSEADVSKRLLSLAEGLEKLNQFEVTEIEKCLRSMADQMGIKAAQLIHPARVALTGRSVSAGIFEIMILLGQTKVVARLKFTAENKCEEAQTI